MVRLNKGVNLTIIVEYKGNKFEWDKNKNKINIKKHGISFQDAIKVFDDNALLVIYDAKHSITEDRYINIGMVNNTLLASVITTDRGGNTRLISADKANKRLKELYYER